MRQLPRHIWVVASKQSDLVPGYYVSQSLDLVFGHKAEDIFISRTMILPQRQEFFRIFSFSLHFSTILRRLHKKWKHYFAHTFILSMILLEKCEAEITKSEMEILLLALVFYALDLVASKNVQEREGKPERQGKMLQVALNYALG